MRSRARYLPGRVAALALVLSVAVLYTASVGLEDPKPGARPHHVENGFRNENPDYRPPDGWTRTKFILSRRFGGIFRPAYAALPSVENDGRALRENGTDATVTWVGHATLFVQLDGVNFLTDPQWSDRASPVSFAGPPRVTPPGLRFEDLPAIHLVLISHDHYDHLDVATVKRLVEAHNPLFLVPLGLKSWLAEIGVTRVEELDWWESRRVRDVTLTLAPAQHFSARTPWDENRRLWGGWVAIGRGKRFYFAGDTGYYEPMFKEIGRRLGPFDLAAIPIGSYMPSAMMRMAHTNPEEALRAFADVKGKLFLGVHWGTFDMTEEPLDEPPKRVTAEARRLGLDPNRVWVFRHGETRPW